MFEVGDKILIKSDLDVGEQYNECYFVSNMKVHRGKTGTIINKLDGDYQHRRYILDIDKDHYFSNDMLESIDDSDSILPKVGDRVRIISEMPKEGLCGICKSTWLKLLGKSGIIIQMNANTNSYMISISEPSVSFWLPLTHFRKESTLTSENSIKNVSKLIEYVPEIELSYCKKQIYTI